MFKLHPMLLCDFYKIAHRAMYPAGTTEVYSTWTPRTSRIPLIEYAVVFGHQYFVTKWLIDFFETEFFNADIEEIIAQYVYFISSTLNEPAPFSDHIRDLHRLGYLPLHIEGVPEGTIVPIRTPVLTITNTDPRFFWLTNYVESLMSAEMWQASTSATLANEFRFLLDDYAMGTVGNTDFVPYQAHDFSFRGMSSVDSAVASGMGHLLSFQGSDNIPAILAAAHYYGAHIENGATGTSIPASEHSVQCAYADDIEYFRRLITEIHPTGLVSIVADGYDFWDVIGRVLPALKNTILARDGKLVIRPDSGDPFKIICGDPEADNELARKGALLCLFELFGTNYPPGKTPGKFFAHLNEHIGLIYGDAITRERAEKICVWMERNNIASTNVVFGVGSYTYQYNTRDTLGYALKSTNAVIDGVETPIFKKPATDDGTKFSQKGRVFVGQHENGQIGFADDYGSNLADGGPIISLLRPIFIDGKQFNIESFHIIKERLASARKRLHESIR